MKQKEVCNVLIITTNILMMEATVNSIRFKKDNTSITVFIGENPRQVKAITKIRLEEIENEYFLEIPELKISLSTRDKESIEKKIHNAVTSFLDYRLKKKGLESFILTMYHLGFDMKITDDHEDTPQASLKVKSKKFEETFDLASWG